MNIIVISGPSNSGKTHLATCMLSVMGAEEPWTIAATKNNCRTRTAWYLLRVIEKSKDVVVLDEFRNEDKDLMEGICGMYDTNENNTLIIITTQEKEIPSLLKRRASVIRTKRRTV